MPPDRLRLGVDFGTSTTVAMLQRANGSVTPLLFDASPLLSSGVYAGPDAQLLTGADADRAAVAHPARYEPNPKRRIDDGTTWLDDRELPVVELVAAVLARVIEEARRVAGRVPESLVLTHPATWSRVRLAILADAARQAGFAEPLFVAEPIAAAAYFASVLGRDVPAGRCLVVYDLGAGTFDVTVVRRAGEGFEVVAADGLSDVGGLDLDAAVVEHARGHTAGAAGEWGRLDWPESRADQRARRTLWQGARAAKEQLSRHVAADLHVPLADADLHVTRDEFDKAARPHLERTVALTVATLRAAGVPGERIAGVFLVGGSSRVPLAATLLHRTLRIAPTTIDQPELVVAMGSLHTLGLAAAAPLVPRQPVVEPQPAPAAPVPQPAGFPLPPAPVAAAPAVPAPRVVARAAVPAGSERVMVAGVALADPVAVRVLRVLASYAVAPLPRDVLAPLAAPAALDAALRLLAARRLVKVGADAVTIRRQARDAVVEELSWPAVASLFAETMRTATGLLRRAVPQGEPRRESAGWPRWAVLRPHLSALSARCPDALGGPDLAWLMCGAGQYEHVQGRYAQSLVDHQRAVDITEATQGPDHADLAPRLELLATARRIRGRLDGMLELHQRALAISEATLGPEHPETARRLGALAAAKRVLGAAAESEPLHRRAIAITEAALGPDHPDLGDRLLGLAYTLSALGRPAEAEPLCRRSLAIAEAAFGPAHHEVAYVLAELADELRDLGRTFGAEPLERRSLAIIEAAFGPDHPDIAFRWSGLALTLRHRGRLEEAEPLYRRALAIAEASAGRDSAGVAALLSGLAGLLNDLGRPADAEPPARRALQIEEGIYGPDHPDVADYLATLADALHRLDRSREALPLYQRAMALTEKAYGEDHPRMAYRLAGLAAAVLAADLPEVANTLYARAVAVSDRVNGPDHADAGVWLERQVECLRGLRRTEEAEPLARRCLAIGEAVYGPNHEFLAGRLVNLAAVLRDLGRDEEGAALQRRAYAIAMVALGEDHPTTVNIRGHLPQSIDIRDYLDGG
ncbi:tetratricopeptide repeat protein [Dactylosporangium salmoneum]